MSKNDFIKLYCFGCGAELQNDDPNKQGYIPKYLEKDSQYLCQRCFRLQHYGINAEDQTYNNDYKKIIEQAKRERGLIIYVVDLFAFECSIVQSLINQLKDTRLLVIASKRDVIPSSVKDTKLINFVKERLNEYNLNPLDILISSSANNYNLEDIIKRCTTLRKRKNIYIFGATSVGKSSLVNAFLKMYENNTTQLISTSPYPGTTLDVIKVPLSDGCFIYDTPGVYLDTSIYAHLDKKLLKYVMPNKEIKPRVYQLLPHQSLLFENICKIDFISNEKTNVTIYLSNYLTVTRCKEENSNKTFNNMIKNKQFKYLDRNISSIDDLILHELTLPNNYCDIVVAGLLWIKIKGKGEVVHVFTPKGVEVNIRECKI